MERSEGRVVSFEGHGFRWLVVRTKSHQERIAVDHMWDRDVEPYCPMYLEPAWHPRAPRGPVPLFAGYLFARCRPSRQLQAVRFCPGVLGPVVFDGEPASVSQRLIEELREREGERGYVLPAELEYGFRSGQRVKLMAGPLKGLEGVFSGYLRGGQRAQVLMRFLRADHRVEVDTEALAMARC